MFKKLVIAFVLFAVIGIGILAWGQNVYDSAGNYSEQKHVLIAKGSGVSTILAQLEKEGVISQPLLLRVMAKIKGDSNFKYGEYIFEPGLSPAEVFAKLETGAVVVRKVTIPEGKTVYEISEILGKAEGLTGKMPPDIEEGSILPQTYYYQWGDTYESIIKQAQKKMTDLVGRLWEFHRMDVPFSSKEEAVTLASIVERETGNPDERPMVASVFINRLKIGMPLQSDPTAIYGMTAGEPLGRVPNAADIRDDNPYNTYRIKGLPPGPICNPGQASLEAVMNPADTNYLYFVADGMGGHNFAAGLAEHNKYVNEYRGVVREYRKTHGAPGSGNVTPREKSNMIIRPRAQQ